MQNQFEVRSPVVVAPQFGLMSFKGVGKKRTVSVGPAPRSTTLGRVISSKPVILYRPGGTSMAPLFTSASASRNAGVSSATPSPFAPNFFTLTPAATFGSGFSPE